MLARKEADCAWLRFPGLRRPLTFRFARCAHSSEGERRQTIGRGLRLCVNQQGERLRGFEVNTLTVIATESYEAFAENLQKEIEADTGIRFGIVEMARSSADPSSSRPPGSAIRQP